MEAKILLPIVIASVIIFSLLISYLAFLPRKVDISAEIAKLNPDQATIQALNFAECKTLEKGEKVWVVKDCKGDYYFKFFIGEGGYVLGYCTNWSTPREAILKLRAFVGDCVDLNSEDEDLSFPEMREYGLAQYSVCGRKFLFQGECITGTVV